MPSAVLPSRLLRAAAAAALVLVAACGSGGDTDDAEMQGDPSTQPTGGAVVVDSSTQVPSAPAMGATATAQGSTTGATVAPADSSKSRGPIVGTPTGRP